MAKKKLTLTLPLVHIPETSGSRFVNEKHPWWIANAVVIPAQTVDYSQYMTPQMAGKLRKFMATGVVFGGYHSVAADLFTRVWPKEFPIIACNNWHPVALYGDEDSEGSRRAGWVGRSSTHVNQKLTAKVLDICKMLELVQEVPEHISVSYEQSQGRDEYVRANRHAYLLRTNVEMFTEQVLRPEWTRLGFDPLEYFK